MAEDDNLKVIEAVENAIRAKDWDAFRDLHAEDVALHAPDSPEPRKGHDSVIEWYSGFFDGFPDMDVKTLRTFVHGDWVCGEYVVAGTHTGSLPGPEGEPIPPTNKRVSVPSCTVYRVQGGKVAEVHEYFDQLGFLAQLGLVPGNE